MTNGHGKSEQPKRPRQIRVPLVSSRQLVAAMRRLGFVELPSTGSSHLTMWRTRLDGRKDTTTIVLGKRQIPKGTLRVILKAANVTLADFMQALR